MSISTVQATEMAASTTMASAAAAGDGKCLDCDHDGRGMKAMDCRLAVCGVPGVATLAPTFVVVLRTDRFDWPALAQPSLVGWAHAPDPYPPRPRALG